MAKTPKPRIARIMNTIYRALVITEDVQRGSKWVGFDNVGYTPEKKLVEMKRCAAILRKAERELSAEIIRYHFALNEHNAKP